MYGLVNKAIEDFVCHHHGEARWEEIKERAGVDVEFVSTSGYPDALTYRLVAAASELLGVPAAELLERFGEYWVLYTARQGYGELLEAGGRNTSEFLRNLPDFHDRVSLIFRDLDPPSFQCTESPGGSLRLRYTSSRSGLAPMVVGLIRGVARTYGEEVEIALVQSREDGAESDEFVVTVRERTPA